jgi:hydroxypyruvate isomerase
VSLTYSAHISWLFGELPYLERVGAARRAGFHRIETAWPEQAEDREGLAGVVAEQQMEVVLLNCPAGDMEGGERGFLNDPLRREDAERDFLDAADLAQRVGAPSLNALLGRELPGIPLASQRRAVVEALSAFAPEAASRGLRIVVEPVNSIENPGYLAPTPRAALELIEECDSDALGVLLDVYHVARAGGDPLAEIDRCGALIGHVQISDHPGRGRPGSGELDFVGILERLNAVGYRGSVGLEYRPRGTTESSLSFLHEQLYPALL